MTTDATVVNVEDITEDFDRVRLEPCDDMSKHTHIASVYEKVEPNVFHQVSQDLTDYDAVRALVCRAADVPADRIRFELEFVTVDLTER